MFKIAIYMLLSLFLFNYSEGKRKKRETINNWTELKWSYQHQNCGDYLVHAQLRNLSSLFNGEEISYNNTLHTGILEVFLPSATHPLYLCHPESDEDFRAAYIFSHIVCRQLGFMSVVSFNKREISPTVEISRPLYGLRPNSHRCSGQEQNVSLCDWNEVTIADCSTLTEISCGECHSTVLGTSGIIKSPGYPLAHLYDVTCEWIIVVPDDHSILLSTHHFEKTEETASSHCGLQKPYVEIVYGTRNQMTSERYCNLEDIKNISIPHREVQVKVFTGFFSSNQVFRSQDRGMAIYFEAQANGKRHSVPWKAILITLFILIFLAITAMFHYCKKYELCDTRRHQSVLPVVNVPTQAELNRAYEFQRCRIQVPLKEKKGLRLRSNGSSEKSKVFKFPSQSGSNFLSASNIPTYEVGKACPKHPVHDETPKTVIPKIILNDETSEDEQQNPIDRVKTNLVDRYSNNSFKESDVSVTFSSYSPVFYPPLPSFQIYRSVSSESDEKPPPYQTSL